MSRLIRNIVLLLLLGCGMVLKAQEPPVISRVEDNKIVILIDLDWAKDMKLDVCRRFDLDTAIFSELQDNLLEITLDSTTWKVKHLKQKVFELSKNLFNQPSGLVKHNDVFLIDDRFLGPNFEEDEQAVFGRNNLSNPSVFNYSDTTACFYLPGNKNARQVYLAGTFNNWSTYKTPMTLTDSGWIEKVKLKPGKHTYKYIVDGNWMTDPNNKIRENDGNGNINSVIYCYNYTFKLKGFAEASKVTVTGTFCNWDKNGYTMRKTSVGWVLDVFLGEGTYAYKFRVDGNWITDPENPDVRTDGSGNRNSFLNIGQPYIFRLRGYTTAQKVILSGSFNSWNKQELVMQKSADGWQLPYVLSSGNFEYKFIVDGQWVTDTDNPYFSGKDDHVNSLLINHPNYTFTLASFPDAKTVILAGSFNSWNPNGYRMVLKDGKWSLPVYLKPGKHLYKYVVDGKWIRDPGNKLWEENEYGTGNSVLWFKP